ncbi:hypothetical protein E6C76_20130 [Pseudothauera nasutitermitis]|uniref:Uncharacterized protein n=1 Tax=Pseudothauera nasutitermitis TaxID=2565930 RepID=A0A4S4AP32_9RHOO|nr:hypothetical protein [Pseudothauera nasutitermitis]THF61393.1 hypothetical protein E6C76_20130 [Pseudothauera nasutitermitis]
MNAEPHLPGNVIPLPTAASSPVVQPRRRGRFPSGITSLSVARDKAQTQAPQQSAAPWALPSAPRTALDELRSDINIARSALRTLELCLAECEATYRRL